MVRRIGISLTEVLIAMGILTVGLLGVASVFPVASWNMQRAEIADKGSAIGQAVMSELVTTGMLDPSSWFVMTPSPPGGAAGDPNYNITGVDAKYVPHGASPSVPLPASYTRPFAEALRFAEQSGLNPAATSAMMGNAFVIDPMGVAAVMPQQGANTAYRANYAFPASAYVVFPGNSTYYYSTPQWHIWNSPSSGGRATKMTWPIRRVTFRQMSTGYNLDKRLAEEVCRSHDDLTYEFPDKAGLPSSAKWDTTTDASGNIVPLARQWTGDYSWIATVAPTTNEARDAMATSPGSFEYGVSVVVFHKRQLPSDASAGGQALLDSMNNERSVGAKILSTGEAGGEVLLWDVGDNTAESAFTHLKAGNWIMLCGPHPTSTDQDPPASATAASQPPRFVMGWYKVLSIDSAPGTVITDPTKQRIVALRGPQWPWQPRLSYPAGQQASNVAKLSDDLCAGIFRGAVAVHTRTLRMERMSDSGLVPIGTTGNTDKGVSPMSFF